MRTLRDATLDSRASRNRLKPGKETHYKTLLPGKLHLGYRRKEKDAPGLWLVRRYIGNKSYRVSELGLADDFQDVSSGVGVISFPEAQKLALKYADGNHGDLTVETVVNNYIAWLKSHKASGNDAELRANKQIIPELGSIKIADLTTVRLNHWRDKLAETPATLRTKKGEPQKYRKAARTEEEKRARRATVNRVLTTLKAALNHAFEAGQIEDDTAWRRVKPFKKVNSNRPSFLTIAEASRLITSADKDFRPIVHAALLTGCRYGELCALRSRDYQRGKVHIAQSKTGKTRNVVLTDEGVKFFDAVTAGKTGDQLIFTRKDGGAWQKNHQSRLMDDACQRAKIKPAVGIHQLRHTWASHAVMNGMPLLVVARNLGHESTKMIEKHYGHLTNTFFDDAIRESAPRFGVAPPTSNVANLRR